MTNLKTTVFIVRKFRWVICWILLSIKTFVLKTFKKTCQELIGAEFLCNRATDALIVKQMCIKLHFADINCLKQYPFRILKNHSCTIHTPGRKMEHGLARWTEMSFFCWNTELRVLTTVVCDKHCVDHKSCKKIKGYQSRPVLFQFSVQRRNQPQACIRLPISCQCVPRHISNVKICSNKEQRSTSISGP